MKTTRRKSSGDGGPPSAHRVARDALLAELRTMPIDDETRATITRMAMLPTPTAVPDARAVLDRVKRKV